MANPQHQKTAGRQRPDGRRTRHEPRKGELLDAVSRYISENGATDLSLRPLAAAVGVSHRTLLYHFGSKEGLVMQVLEKFRRDHRLLDPEQMEQLASVSLESLLRLAWQRFLDPQFQPYFRLLFEVFGLGLRGPPYAELLAAVVKDRTDLLRELALRHGAPPERASAISSLFYDAWNGLVLDMMATGERERIEAGLEELIRCIGVLLPEAAKTPPTDPAERKKRPPLSF